jgi:hypothetical protein
MMQVGGESYTFDIFFEFWVATFDIWIYLGIQESFVGEIEGQKIINF